MAAADAVASASSILRLARLERATYGC